MTSKKPAHHLTGDACLQAPLMCIYNYCIACRDHLNHDGAKQVIMYMCMSHLLTGEACQEEKRERVPF